MSNPDLGPGKAESTADFPSEAVDSDAPVGPIRCLIVDDESPAREELRFLLDELGGLQVVGSAATAEEALVLLENVPYDIVFLDIRMPGLSGLDVAAKLQQTPHSPQVIFITAYPDHAVDAFDLSAADYLLKPLSSERLAESITRAKARLGSTRRGPDQMGGSTGPLGVQAPASPQHTVPNREIRLPVQRGDRTVFVRDRDIVAAAAAHGYSYIYLNGERVLVNYSLTELEQRLPTSFFRVHRSYLANLSRLVELRPDFKGALVLVMDDEARTRIPVSRRQAQELRRRLGM